MGFNGAINSSLSSMGGAASRTNIVSGNIANSDTGSYKMTEVVAQSVVNSQSGSTAGVVSSSRQLIDMQGELIRSDVATDLAIQGDGFVMVTDKFTPEGLPTNIFVTRDLSFRKDQTNRLVNTSGYYMLAWPLDANANLPETKSLLSSLSDVNVTQWVSEASATTSVNFGANLKSEEIVLGNGVKTIYINNNGLNGSVNNFSIGPNDILYANPNNSLTRGEGIDVTTIITGDLNQKVTKHAIFDGFAETLTFSDSGTGLTTAVGGQLASDTITIQYGSSSISVTRGTGTTNYQVLEGIANQINQNTPDINGLRARVMHLGGSTKLIISPTNINQGVTFTGDLAFRNQIGLDDSKNIASFAPDTQGLVLGRFATLKQFADLLNSAGATTYVNYNETVGTSITVSSPNPIAFENYQPLGSGSNFLGEFGLKSGFLASNYDPYDSQRNIAGGNISSHFSQNVTIYDSMGNQQNLMIGFVKTDINTWGIEVYATDKQSVSIAGRTDGLLMAGTVHFNGKGHFDSIEKPTQFAKSKDISTPNLPLGGTVGETLTMTVGATTYSYTYGSQIAKSSGYTLTGTGFTGTAADTLDITVGSSTYNIARGAGTNNHDVILNIMNQINATTGPEAIHADLVYDALSLQYHINIRAVDSSLDVAFGQTGTLGTDLGITNANDIKGSSFESLYELAELINTSQGPNAIRAEVVPGNAKNSYRIRINPVNSNYFVAFGGTVNTVNPPLGTGSPQSLASALGLVSTSSSTQLVGIDETLIINWSSTIGAEPNTINFTWGTFGGTDGLGQVSGNYSIKTSSQNGVSTGNLTGIQIDSEGQIVATFSNSQTRRIYKIPLACFANPNGLIPLPGNVFMVGKDSGALNLKEAGTNGAGQFSPGALEGSNVDLATELTKLIFAQRQYQASSKVINIVDSLLEELVHRTFN